MAEYEESLTTYNTKLWVGIIERKHRNGDWYAVGDTQLAESLATRTYDLDISLKSTLSTFKKDSVNLLASGKNIKQNAPCTLPKDASKYSCKTVKILTQFMNNKHTFREHTNSIVRQRSQTNILVTGLNIPGKDGQNFAGPSFKYPILRFQNLTHFLSIPSVLDENYLNEDALLNQDTLTQSMSNQGAHAHMKAQKIENDFLPVHPTTARAVFIYFPLSRFF
jgi:hypothetical protein